MDNMTAFGPNKHFYPRPPRGGRRADVIVHIQPVSISIHALREEGDARIGHLRGGPA